MRKETIFKGISANFGACFVYYLAILLLARLYPTYPLHLLVSAIVCWVLLPYAERFLQRMTKPIRRAIPQKRGRLVVSSALVKSR